MGIENFIDVKQQLEVTVWEEGGDENGITFNTYVKAVKRDRILVHPPPLTEQKLQQLIEPGLKVGALLVGTRKRVIFYPIVEKRQTQGTVGIWLKADGGIEEHIVQQRRHVRVTMAITVEVTFKQDAEQKRTMKVVTVNMSGGGLRFISPRPFQKGETMAVNIAFPDKEPFDVPVEVMGSSEAKASNMAGSGSSFQIAAQYKGITSAQEQLIMGECFRHETKQRHLREET